MNNYFTRSSFGCAQYKHFIFPCLVDMGGTVRLTNLSENARDSDLQELCGQIGEISRIFLAKVCVTVFSHEYIPFADNVISFPKPRIRIQESLVALLSSHTNAAKTPKEPSKPSMALVTTISFSL